MTAETTYHRDQVRTDWTAIGAIDLYPPPGSFVSHHAEREFTVDYDDSRVVALNPLHAEYLWVKRQVGASGDEFGRCVHCGTIIRHAVIVRDGEGKYHTVGEQCAKFIGSGLSRVDFSRGQILGDIKTVRSAKGVRWVLKRSITKHLPGFWDVPKDQRPSYTTLYKWDNPHARKREEKAIWFVQVWGADQSEVIDNWFALVEVVRVAHAAVEERRREEEAKPKPQSAYELAEALINSLEIGDRVRFVAKPLRRRQNFTPLVGWKGRVLGKHSYGANYRTVPCVTIEWDEDEIPPKRLSQLPDLQRYVWSAEDGVCCEKLSQPT
jgi:hypothetical protein